jgi:hypothetical protein
MSTEQQKEWMEGTKIKKIDEKKGTGQKEEK